MRPSISSITASTIGCEYCRRARSAQVRSHRSSQRSPLRRSGRALVHPAPGVTMSAGSLVGVVGSSAPARTTGDVGGDDLLAATIGGPRFALYPGGGALGARAPI